MTVFAKIAYGCALGLALLSPLDVSHAASKNPTIVIPPRANGSVLCDYRGCFGFGRQQWYRRPGQPIPNPPPALGGRNRYDNPGIVIPPRNSYVPPKTNYRAPVDNSTRHRVWCADRYRTYNPGTNLYTTLHNGFQACRSPYQ
ncbi:BA14K family protein [Agrobacterium rhizogenes]|uniref:BA14K family protein n=1 Tax=Rhizobium rhizogenes TaxID=359 RepID=UPI001573F730|nr:BA14K family protein [Rhizobium rhizogenes]NTG50028.1 BA14K family protein [Rhizobium rhizogenes]